MIYMFLSEFWGVAGNQCADNANFRITGTSLALWPSWLGLAPCQWSSIEYRFVQLQTKTRTNAWRRQREPWSRLINKTRLNARFNWSDMMILNRMYKIWMIETCVSQARYDGVLKVSLYFKVLSCTVIPKFWMRILRLDANSRVFIFLN